MEHDSFTCDTIQGYKQYRDLFQAASTSPEKSLEDCFFEHEVGVAAVCCSLLQSVAGCCSLLQSVAGCCSLLQFIAICCSLLQSVAVCCRMLPYAAVYAAVCCSLLQAPHRTRRSRIAPLSIGRVSQCAAVCCSMLQCAAVCCSVL